MKPVFLMIAICSFLFSCNYDQKLQLEVQSYLDNYNKAYQRLSYESNKADWQSNIMIVEGDSTNSIASRKANEALAAFTGSTDNINKAKEYLKSKNRLKPLQVKQLEKILYKAANNPQTIANIVKERIKAETEQTQKLYGYKFKIKNVEITPNGIDEILSSEKDINKRLEVWNASKESCKVLKDGLTNLQ